jgi:iron complex outermembrane receptor protein
MRVTNHRVHHAVVSLLALSLPAMKALAAPAASDTENSPVLLEEIIVTAQKREQSSIEVPISMTTIDAAEIEARRVRGFEDFVLAVPNVTYAKTAEYDISVTIRGISGKTGGRFDPVGVTVDDISFGSIDTATILSARSLDIERVEVLRGPQGTLTANNSMGGAINIITAKPEVEKTSFKAIADYSRFDTRFLKSTANLPVNDKLAFRLVAFGETSDGAVKNIGPSGGDSGGDSYGGRVAMLWLPTENLDIDTSFAYETQHLGIETALPIDRFTGGATARAAAIKTIGTLGGNYLNSDFIEGSGNNGGTVQLDVPEKNDIKDWYGSFRSTYTFGQHSVSLLYSHYDFTLHNPIDIDQSEFAVRRSDRWNWAKTDGTELRFSSKYSGPINWVAGLAYSNERNPFFNFSTGGNNKLGGTYPNLLFKFRQEQNLRSEGAFANLFWDLTQKLHVSTGIRYSKVKSEYGTVQVTTGGLAAVLPPITLTSADLSNVSPRIGVNYDFLPEASVYAQFATGFRAGFGNLLRSTGTHRTTIGTINIPADVKDERIKNYEVGLKGLFLGQRLSLGAALFYMDYTDLQVRAGQVLDTTEVGLSFNLNAGHAFSRGFELEAAARPITGLDIRLGAGYVDTYISELNGVPLRQDIPGVRPWTTNATVSYEFPLTAGGLTANVRGDYIWQEKTYDSLTIVPAGELPRFGEANFAVGLGTYRWNASAYINNAFSETYWFGTAAAATQLRPAASYTPRTFGLRFTVRFGDE